MLEIALGLVLGFFGVLGSLIVLGLGINFIKSLAEWFSNRS